MKTTFGFSRLCLALLLCISFNQIQADGSLAFSLVCPADKHVSCEDEIWDLSIYGTAYVSTYSGPQPAGDPVVVWDLNGCDIGEVYRTWTVEDYSGVSHSCTQTIFVSGSGTSFNQSFITWPQNLSLEGCIPATDPQDLPPVNAYPTYWTPPCATVGATYSDQLFQISNTCKKLRRTWTIIDWCQYDPANGITDGYYTYFQDIKLTQNEEPIVNCVDTIYGKTNNCIEGEIFAASLEVAPNSCGTEFTISNNSPYADDNGANISGIYPIGITKVQYTIHYGCGKRKYCYVNVYVEDISVPTPYCYQKIHTALMPMDTDGDGIIDNGMVEIWAKDFDLNTSSPCGNDFTPSFSPDEVVMWRSFDCNDVGENQFNVYYLSSNGNYSFCTVILDVQNNDDIPNCEAQLNDDTNNIVRISGNVESVFKESMQDILVECQSVVFDTTYIHEIDTTTTYITIDSFINASGVMIYHQEKIIEITETFDTLVNEFIEQHHLYTDEEGEYSFDSVDMHKDYYISATCEDVDLKLLDKCDLDMLIDHIMGDALITDPALLFAADIDENDKVDFDDVKYLMFYLGGHYQTLPYEQAYYIFPADTEEFTHENLSDFHYSNIDADQTETNFTYIMKGNLCQQEFNSQQFPSTMNILTSVAEKLPINIRSEVQQQLQEHNELAPEFSLYPNPFYESIVVNVNNPKAQIVEIEIFNSAGKRVYRRSAFLDKGIHNLDNDLENETPGIYFFQIKAGETEYHGKVIKN